MCVLSKYVNVWCFSIPASSPKQCAVCWPRDWCNSLRSTHNRKPGRSCPAAAHQDTSVISLHSNCSTELFHTPDWKLLQKLVAEAVQLLMEKQNIHREAWNYFSYMTKLWDIHRSPIILLFLTCWIEYFQVILQSKWNWKG